MSEPGGVLRFASLGSGSRGNATLIEAGETRVLLDNGFSVRETLRRLARLDVSVDTLSAILVTHEHSDHVNGVAGLASRHNIPVFLTAGTKRVMEARGLFNGLVVDCHRVMRGMPFVIGGLTIFPLRVPHDAEEPCQFVFEAQGARLGVLTDVGSFTSQLMEAYAACDALFLECNHDARMLADGPYPASLKTRVGGDFGHLSNAQAAQLLAKVDKDRLATLVIGHVSEKNNLESLVRQVVATAMGWAEEAIVVASQSDGHGWLSVYSKDARAAGNSGVGDAKA